MNLSNLRGTLLRILVALAALALAVYVLRGVDLRRTIEIILQANIALLVVALLLKFADMAMRAVRWKYELLPCKDLKASTVFSPLLISFFVGNVTVTGVGLIPRVFVLKRKTGVDEAFAAGTIAQEFSLDATALLLFAVILPAFLDFPPEFITIQALMALPLMLFLAIDLAMIRHESLTVTLIKRLGLWDRLLNFLPSFIRENLDAFGDGMGGAFFHPQTAVMVTGTTFLIWIIDSLTFWVLMLSLSIPFGFLDAATVMSYTNAAMSIVAVPGFLGTLDASAIGLMLALSAPQDAALAFTVLLRVYVLIPSTVIGAIFASREGLRLGTGGMGQTGRGDM